MPDAPDRSAAALTEDDAPLDAGLANSRATGGEPDDHPDDRTEADRLGTAGTGPTEEFVGRVAGDDPGYAGETGAEARAAAGEENP